MKPTRLRIEHGPRPLGVACTQPRLSWWLPTGVVAQEAYRIQADNEGALVQREFESAESVLQPWPFTALRARDAVRWRVQVRADDGWSDWSDWDGFEVGLLEVTDWRASFIGHPDSPSGPVWFRQRFTVDTVSRARVYATAHGIYELHLDGVRVGDLELTPGWTSYRSNLEVQTYDVTALLGPGEHTLTATVTDGWWRGAVGFTHERFCYGKDLALLAQVEVDGDVVAGTDGSWLTSTEGPLVAADLMEGERVDQRIPFPPTAGWVSATVVGFADDRLTASPAPPTRRVESIVPMSVTRLDADRQVVDLGANINGWVRVAGEVLGPAGNVVRLRHGESLGADDDVDTDHLRSFDFFTKEVIEVGQIDEVVSDGTGAAFEPRHTTHGFQYISVEGAADLTLNDVTGYFVHTDMARTGSFRCSDQRVNALHDATVRSFRGNACEVPTDCPQRERVGWTGDWQIFIPSAAFLYDVAGFSDRWLRDLAADQWPDGRVPNFIPEPYNPLVQESSIAAAMTGSAGWGDAAVYVPYQLWQSYGDVDVVARQYSSMQRWVAFALGRAAELRHHSRVALRPEPSPHERFLWDVGFHWGEWLEPGVDSAAVLSGEVDVAEVATAYLYRSLRTLADIAKLLGEEDDARTYRGLAEEARAAWRAEFVVEGVVQRATQANLARAVAFDLVDDVERERAVADLVALVRVSGNHVGTGFLATPFLLPVLADNGQLDVAYDLLLQTTPPSWLAMIEAGATTVWENWDRVDAGGLGSLNHYSKGAVVSFLHEYVAGIRPMPGVPAYGRFVVAPRPGGGLTSAAATLDSPYGRISSSWRIEGGRFSLDVEVPPGTMAEITLPDGRVETRGPGTHYLT